MVSNKTRKSTTQQVHTLVYKHFKNQSFNGDTNKLVFLDGNINNCNYNNIISVEDLKAFYLKYNNKVIDKN